MALGYQSFYQTQLTANITDTDLVIPVADAPIPDEGYLVIESTVANKREIIYYTSKGASSVTCPIGGRGYDGTTATSHLANAAVIMAPVAAMFEALTDLFTTTPQGWTNLGIGVSSVTYNGNRSYDITFASTVASILSSGMRLRTTRTVAAPTTCFSFDGSNDYYNDTTVAGMTFTDDFTVGRWVYLTSYASCVIQGRYNGTSGWYLILKATGQVQLVGHNAGAGNYSLVESYKSVPLNKWVYIAAQLDMSAFTATTTTSYIMIDGKNAPCTVTRGGTNPTALVQAGNLEVGSINGGTSPFPGRMGGGFISSTKITQANILTLMGQELTVSDVSTHSMVSAWVSGSTTDLNTTNANNLAAQNGATTANYSPFGNNGTSSTLDYALVMNVNAAVVTVQVPEGCTIPTSGGVASAAYATSGTPFGWVGDTGRWGIESVYMAMQTQATAATTSYNNVSAEISVPIGSFNLGYQGTLYIQDAAAVTEQIGTCLSLTAASKIPLSGRLLTVNFMSALGATTVAVFGNIRADDMVSFSSATDIYANFTTQNALDAAYWYVTPTVITNPRSLTIYATPSNL